MPKLPNGAHAATKVAANVAEDALRLVD